MPTPQATPREDHPPFVLLHGGRHGGWCWKKVARLLRAAGHEVYTPTLTGLGDRAHLNHPGIGLSTHVRDLVATFEYEDIDDAILVAHSYGGIVAGGAMEHIHHRVRHMVYFDAQIPVNGESVFDMIGPARTEAMMQDVNNNGESWYVPPSDVARYGVTDPGDAAWANSRITAQPVQTYRERSGPVIAAETHPGIYIECTPSRVETNVRERARERSMADQNFRYITLDAPHDAMITHPRKVASILSQTPGTG